MTRSAPTSHRSSRLHGRPKAAPPRLRATAYSVQQARLAIAVHVYRQPALLDEVDGRLSDISVTGVFADLADLINEYPRLCTACAGSLLGIAEQSGRSEEVIAQFSFLHFMPDDFLSQLPPFQVALEMVSARREALAPLGMVKRWRSDVVNGKDGQRPDAPATWKFDHLWRAACYEVVALEYQSLGLMDAADEMMNASARAFQAGVAAR